FDDVGNAADPVVLELADMDQALDALFELDERAEIGRSRDQPGHRRPDRIFAVDRTPRILLELLHPQADFLRLGIELENPDLNGVANLQDVTGMADAVPTDLAHVKEPVD